MAEAFVRTIKRDYVRVTQCRVRDASAAVLDRPLQRGSPAQGLQPAMAIGASALQCRSQRFQMFLGWRRNRLSLFHDVGNENS